MSELYTIKPLEWAKSGDGDFSAQTPFGSYKVYRPDWIGWHWGYCFDEWYDEDSFPCEDAEAGKAAAEANWLERIAGALALAPNPNKEG